MSQHTTATEPADAKTVQTHIGTHQSLTWGAIAKGFLSSPSGSTVFTCSAGDMGSIPVSGRSLEEGMATHSSTLAGKIPCTEEPAGLQSMGSQRVGHD